MAERADLFVPDPEAVSWIHAWPELVSNQNLQSYSQGQRSSIQASLRDNVLTMLNLAIGQSLTDQLGDGEVSGGELKLSKARELIRQVEDYSYENTDRSLRMVDLCRLTEVSERTLQYVLGHFANELP